jgi:tryptophan 2,3-dioxygenase
MTEHPALTYGRYLKVEELLGLQQPLSDGPEHDELLFITIHQVYELWFQQCLHELRALGPALTAGDTARALFLLRRVLTIFKTLVGQVDILETMTPLQFNAFRARLEASSGFQSAQFRELEFRLGYVRPAMLKHYPEDSPEQRRLSAALSGPTVYDAFLVYLVTQGHALPESSLRATPGEIRAPDAQVQEVLVGVYRQGSFAAQVCERLVDLDEGLQEWRYRHVKMVERTIGVKPGSGGSSGADYLRATLFKPLFPDLWAIRARL